MPKKSAKKTNAKKHHAKATASAANAQRPRRSKGGVIRLTSHKARSKWFQARSSWPVREAPISKLVTERARAKKRLGTPLEVEGNWECEIGRASCRERV